MVLTHFLITRFSCTQSPPGRAAANVTGFFTTVNPLAPGRLARRFLLFETFCVPSVLAQTTRDFTWVILIDPQLTARDRSRLHELTSGVTTRFLEFDPDVDYAGVQWLLPYVDRPDTTHIVTTTVDDDDLMAADVVESIQGDLRRSADSGQLPPCTAVGFMNPLQWDFMPTRRAPLGYVKPWHRNNYPANPAYTLCSKQPEYDISVLALWHSSGASYFDPGVTLADPAQARLRRAAERAGDDWRSWVPEHHLHILDSNPAPIVVVNHLENDQMTRLFEAWAGRRPVTGPADFPGMPVRYETIALAIRSFRRSPSVLVRYLYRTLRLLLSTDTIGVERRLLLLFGTIMLPVWFFRGVHPSRVERSRE